MTAYYNEIDPHAAQWLRNLMAEGWITQGDVDERSIEDVRPNDLAGYDRAHFFAGVGVWDYALNQAGWGRREIWTGSCPCQPFSAAGKGAGFDDERHLWPAFHHLISQCKPAIVLGEQVASKDADTWIDLVHTDMEALGYAFGAIPFPAAGVGAPHIRDRLYWVGNASSTGLERYAGNGCAAGRQGSKRSTAATGIFGGLADTKQHHRGSQATAANHGEQEADRPTDRTGGCGVLAGGMADTDSHGCKARDGIRLHGPEHDAEHGSGQSTERPGPTNGHWRDADWLLCRDGKWRPVEPGTFPLAHGASSRVVRLRAYGNSITAQAAQAFIECLI